VVDSRGQQQQHLSLPRRLSRLLAEEEREQRGINNPRQRGVEGHSSNMQAVTQDREQQCREADAQEQGLAPSQGREDVAEAEVPAPAVQVLLLPRVGKIITITPRIIQQSACSVAMPTTAAARVSATTSWPRSTRNGSGSLSWLR
jgi:hypothetical protein